MGNDTSTQQQNVEFPPPFKTIEEFNSSWFVWRKKFCESMEAIDIKKEKIELWPFRLLNRVGAVGQEICDAMNVSVDKQTYQSLLTVFDNYCVFGTKKMGGTESPYTYVKDLKEIASQKCPDNAVQLVRGKLKTEIDADMFTKAATTLMPCFKFHPDFEILTLNEIAFILERYNRLNDKRKDIIHNCKKCGQTHPVDCCTATGMKCLLCQGPDHLNIRCPQGYSFNCMYCNGEHAKRQCPAFYEICRSCDTRGHFSWQCKKYNTKITCHFCGQEHRKNRNDCPAKNTLCTKCGERGHFFHKCKKR